jgi:hypothetical protein
MAAACDQCQLRKRATYERNVKPGRIKKKTKEKKRKEKGNGPSIE